MAIAMKRTDIDNDNAAVHILLCII